MHSFILIYSSMALKRDINEEVIAIIETQCSLRISFRIYKIQTAENAAIWGFIVKGQKFWFLLSSKCGLLCFSFHLFQGRVLCLKRFWSSECTSDSKLMNHFLKEN